MEKLANPIDEKLTQKEKERKSELEDELKDLEHKWMKEGRLSSDLQERYGISDKDAVGKVLWHSLNENGDIGVYDMKFGNTIIRNLTEADIIGEAKPHKRDDEHGAQDEDDSARGKKK